jgi:hypothetical protein
MLSTDTQGSVIKRISISNDAFAETNGKTALVQSFLSIYL